LSHVEGTEKLSLDSSGFGKGIMDITP
jgi:hypothetical protein